MTVILNALLVKLLPYFVHKKSLFRGKDPGFIHGFPQLPFPAHPLMLFYINKEAKTGKNE